MISLSKIWRGCVALAALSVSACAYPESKVTLGADGPPSVYFTGAPKAADVFIDGRAVGRAADFDGDKGLLQVTPGTHKLEVRDGDRLLLRRDIFVGRTGSMKIEL